MEAVELESCVPPGFRFHPTEEELVGYYLARKVSSQKIDLEVITDVDLYRIEPWDLQEKCKLGYDEQKEWYFFSHKDKKYPTGTRTNRATAAGFWKATGRDKAVLSKTRVIGMRKTLVFYVGRAPNGRKSDWIIHEYRLQSSEHEPPQDEGWVVCRAFMKQIPNVQRPCFNTYSNPNYYIRNHELFGSASALSDPTRNTQFMDTNLLCNLQQQFRGTEGELELKQSHNHVFDNPRIESSSMSLSLGTMECFESNVIGNKEFNHGQIVDWKTFDKLLTPQSSEHASYSSSNVVFSPLDCDVNAQDPDNFLASFDN